MFPNNLNERESYILKKVRDGESQFGLSKLRSTYKENTSVFFVMSEPLRIDGTIVNCSARLQQRIADFLGMNFLSEKLASILYKNSDFKLEPAVRQITSSTKAMIEHSQAIDKQLSGFDKTNKLIGNGGKHWIIGKKATDKKSINYGWFTETNSNSWKGIKVYPPASDTTLKVIQPASTAHDPSHVDYSQTCTLVAGYCVVNGKDSTLTDVNNDPTLSYLFSHEGSLPHLRQPGITQEDFGVILPGSIGFEFA